jgi:hypothetical protein
MNSTRFNAVLGFLFFGVVGALAGIATHQPIFALMFGGLSVVLSVAELNR